jgi:hypothetical protein
MTKIKLNNYMDFENLKIELTEDEGNELSFQEEETPTSYPCIAIHHYSDDVDFGSVYHIEFVYFQDFHPCLKTINLN